MSPINKKALKVKVPFKRRISRFYQEHIIPSLYFVSFWMCLSSISFLIFEDLIKAAGIASGISLFYILLGKRNAELEVQRQSLMRNLLEEKYGNAESAEEKGE